LRGAAFGTGFQFNHKALLNSIVDYVLRIIVLAESRPAEKEWKKATTKASSPVIASRGEAIQPFLFGLPRGKSPSQ